MTDRSPAPGYEQALVADLIESGQNYLTAKDQLAAHLRAGSHPTEAWWRWYEECRVRWQRSVETAQSGEERSAENGD